MFGIGETELLIIVAFGFMIFGPDKLPGMGRTIGRALRQFRQAQEGFTEVVQSEVMDPLQEAMGDPLDTGTRKQRRATAEERAAALAQDADIDAPEAKAAAHKETFAERKARLAAEKKVREEKMAAELEAAQAADEDLPEEQVTSDVQESEEAPVKPEAPDTSAAALYAMGGRSAFSSAKEKEAEEKAQKEAEAAAKKAAKEAEKAAEEASAAQQAVVEPDGTASDVEVAVSEEEPAEAEAVDAMAVGKEAENAANDASIQATASQDDATEALDADAETDGKEDGSIEA